MEMAEIAASGSINRIIIAVDASLRGFNMLEVAAKLAARRQIELAVLFIEDVNLINFAGLPFAREIDLVSAVERELDDLQLVRSLQSQAQKTSRFLEQLASQLKVNYSFRVLRGDYMKEVFSASLETDVLFLSKRIGRYNRLRLEWTRRSSPAFFAASPVADKNLCVIYDGSPGSDRALALARELALAADRGLMVMLRVDENKSVAQLREQVASITGGGDRRVQYVVITDDNSSLTKALHRQRCEMLILHKSDKEQLTDSLLEDPGCPVVLVQ